MFLTVLLMAIAVSMVGIWHLAQTDPKSQKIHFPNQVKTDKTRCVACANTLIFLPALLLLFWGRIAEFSLWLAAVSLSGWWVAVRNRPSGGRDFK